MRKAALTLCLLWVVACGGDGDFEESCTSFCAPPTMGAEFCDDSDSDSCQDACVARTDGLSVACASCVIEQSTGLFARNFDCEGPDLALVTDPSCASVCN